MTVGEAQQRARWSTRGQQVDAREAHMSKRYIPIVRNTIGQSSRFSVRRYAADAVADGDDIDTAIARGRRLLRDIRRDGAALITTDDIRHWTFERDPLIFAHRRCLRQDSFDGSRRWLDPQLGRIAALATLIAPRSGRALTELFIDYFRPGAGDLLFFMAPPDDKAPLVEDLDEQFAGGETILYPGRPDFSKPGEAGTRVADVFTDSRKRFLYFVNPDDTVNRTGFRPGNRPACGESWIFRIEYMRKVPGCTNVQYERFAKEAKLQGFAEMFNVCQAPCPLPVPTIDHIEWFCDEDVAHVIIFFAVKCAGTGG
jgi:hypothetical protein